MNIKLKPNSFSIFNLEKNNFNSTHLINNFNFFNFFEFSLRFKFIFRWENIQKNKLKEIKKYLFIF